MRQTLKDLIRQVVGLEYTLPIDGAIPKVAISTEPDGCYRVSTSNQDLAKVIYNGIVEYSFDNLDSYLDRLSDAQIIALKTKLKYNAAAAEDIRLKYGFYGEVLLFLFLQYYHNADTVISRGWFYQPTALAEVTGYDTYQMVERNGSVELWFGEVKFYQSYIEAVKKILKKVGTSLSDDYLEANILDISQHVKEVNPKSQIDHIINAWLDNPSIVIKDELVKYNMTLVYPMMVIFDDKSQIYDNIIKEVVEYINREYPTISYNVAIPTKLFFMLLPVKSSKAIKTQVLSWIDTKEALI
ncbi:MAG: DUF1837 domain-containing protein [Paludibacteraceae bacterium]|nr:DUF1837 domain-containing protein [Paludibacteraceae bacterium]